jgi:hypothetical protein
VAAPSGRLQKRFLAMCWLITIATAAMMRLAPPLAVTPLASAAVRHSTSPMMHLRKTVGANWETTSVVTVDAKNEEDAKPSTFQMSLPQKVKQLRSQLDLAEGLTLSETVADACLQLGLETAPLTTLRAKVDACLQQTMDVPASDVSSSSSVPIGRASTMRGGAPRLGFGGAVEESGGYGGYNMYGSSFGRDGSSFGRAGFGVSTGDFVSGRRSLGGGYGKSYYSGSYSGYGGIDSYGSYGSYGTDYRRYDGYGSGGGGYGGAFTRQRGSAAMRYSTTRGPTVAAAVPVAEPSAPTPGLRSKVETLRTQLDLPGDEKLATTVAKAADALGLEDGGEGKMTLAEKVDECLRQVTGTKANVASAETVGAYTAYSSPEWTDTPMDVGMGGPARRRWRRGKPPVGFGAPLEDSRRYGDGGYSPYRRYSIGNHGFQEAARQRESAAERAYARATRR